MTKNGNIKIIDSEEIKCMRGSQIDQRSVCSPEINCQIALGCTALMSMN